MQQQPRVNTCSQRVCRGGAWLPAAVNIVIELGTPGQEHVFELLLDADATAAALPAK